MNATIASLTIRSALGRRRALVLLALPALLLGLAVLARLAAGAEPELVDVIVQGLGLGTVMPLLGLIAGTLVIAPEIEDRSITWLLAKPTPRSSIYLSKLVVAIVIVLVAGAVPIALAALVVTGGYDVVALAFGLAAAAAGVAYAGLFCMLPLVTRNAVFIGLAYALVWETLVGQLIPGAQALSVQQWSLAIAERVLDGQIGVPRVSAAVELSTGLTMLAATTAVSAFVGIRRLRSLRPGGGGE